MKDARLILIEEDFKKITSFLQLETKILSNKNKHVLGLLRSTITDPYNAYTNLYKHYKLKKGGIYPSDNIIIRLKEKVQTIVSLLKDNEQNLFSQTSVPKKQKAA